MLRRFVVIAVLLCCHLTIAEDWEEFFGSQQPHDGKEVGDYVSGVFRDVDQTN